MSDYFKEILKKEIKELSSRAIREAILDDVKLERKKMISFYNSSPCSRNEPFYLTDDRVYKGLSVDKSLKFKEKIYSKYDLSLRIGFSGEEVICEVSPGVTISIVEIEEKFLLFEMNLRFRPRVDFYYSPLSVFRKETTFFSLSPFFMVTAPLKSACLIFLGFFYGLEREIF